MTEKILDGKLVQQKIFTRLKTEIEELQTKIGVKPRLTLIKVGNDKASTLYLTIKEKACAEVGITSEIITLNNPTTRELIDLIYTLNNNSQVQGILLQLPLPSEIDEQLVLEAIDPKKDVDGFHPFNVGRLWQTFNPYFFPCTPLGIYTLIADYKIDLSGKDVVIVNRSNIVGKPLAGILCQKIPFANATVTLCHSGSKNLLTHIKNADAIISAVGKPHIITADMVKQGAVLIDVGTSVIKDETKKSGYRSVGDIDFDGVLPKASFITPVPGGVGPMTVAMLMQNTVRALKLQNNLELKNHV